MVLPAYIGLKKGSLLIALDLSSINQLPGDEREKILSEADEFDNSFYNLELNGKITTTMITRVYDSTELLAKFRHFYSG